MSLVGRVHHRLSNVIGVTIKIFHILGINIWEESYLMMVIWFKNFFEVEDFMTFKLAAQQSPLIIRKDPYLFAQYYSGMFYINLVKLEQENVKALFEILRGKTMIVKNIVKASSISDFVSEAEKVREV
ncbi:MAG: hypothetical protein QXJ17_08325 [Nitrososphaeria archaeon]